MRSALKSAQSFSTSSAVVVVVLGLSFGCGRSLLAPRGTLLTQGDGGLPTDGGRADGGLDAGSPDGGSFDGGCHTDSCTAPPEAFCLTSSTRRIYETPGICIAGGCQYSYRHETCPNSCVAGACVGSCNGMSCNTPPAATCISPTTLRTFNATGTCAQGMCTYGSTDSACMNGCSNGACNPATCMNVVCNQPPNRVCLGLSGFRTYSPMGTCMNGTCTYPSMDTSCTPGDEVCNGGACVWSDTSLLSLDITPSMLVFSSTLTTYATTVPTGTMQVTVKPSVRVPSRVEITLNGATVTSGSTTALAISSSTQVEVVVQNKEHTHLTRYVVTLTVAQPTTVAQVQYIKASNTGPSDVFGTSVAMNADGTTMAVGAPFEDSSATGINGNQMLDNFSNSGAVYVFTRSSTTWSQQAYVKASNSGPNDAFGRNVRLSADGNTLVVAAPDEDSSAIGINGNAVDNGAANSGAIYVFTRAASTWVQQAYLKASNTTAADQFGWSIDLSGDGNTLVVGAVGEDSNATGINGMQNNEGRADSGAAYVFVRSNGVWSQQAYVKATNPDAFDLFGWRVALSRDGNTIAVTARGESSSAQGINGNQTNNSAFESGAVYVYTRNLTTWSFHTYLKASNAEGGDHFGDALAISADGNLLAVGAASEASAASGLDGNQMSNGSTGSGAVYLFTRSNNAWLQSAYMKALVNVSSVGFGSAISMSNDGTMLLVGAPYDRSNATGINGNTMDLSAPQAGAAYLFTRTGTVWSQRAYIKASNTELSDQFGTALALSHDKSMFAVCAINESSNASGVGGNQNNNNALGAGAVYVFTP